ncbi:hypothetical protein AB1K32_08205 [Metabacillus dongyingensis]|uniref:hypothetical protein n=1 Tax=Metabacillus dongyingensis TaxID=2874282 RepID=UPI003B8B5250
MEQSYKEYENTELWNLILKGIDEISENQDIQELTRREYIVGYLCKIIGQNK